MWFQNIIKAIKKLFLKIFRSKKKEVTVDFNTFPLIQRTYFSVIGNDLISVQPMSAPSGITFFIDYNYGNPNAATRKVLIEKYKDPYKNGVNMDYYSTFNFRYDAEYGEIRHGR